MNSCLAGLCLGCALRSFVPGSIDKAQCTSRMFPATQRTCQRIETAIIIMMTKPAFATKRSFYPQRVFILPMVNFEWCRSTCQRNDVCALHIKLILPPICIQHNQVPVSMSPSSQTNELCGRKLQTQRYTLQNTYTAR